MRIAVFWGALLLAGCALAPLSQDELEDVPLKAVAAVDLDRYMGRWYMIANIPYFAEAGNVAVHVDYSRREDGMIDDLYTARDDFGEEPFHKKGLIVITDPQTRAYGSIKFGWAPWQDFAVVYLDPDYRYTAIAHPSRNFCWLFAREPHMPEEIYGEMIQVLEENLFDVARVQRIPQLPEQVGAAGFQ